MPSISPEQSQDAWQAHCYKGRHVDSAAQCQLTVLQALASQALRFPQAPVFTEVDAGGRRHTLTFRQLDTLSQAGAAWLHESAGIRRQQVFGLVPLNDLRSIVAIFSAMRLGARIAFLDPYAPPARHLAIMNQLGVTLVIRSEQDKQGVDARVFPRLADLPAPGNMPLATESNGEVFYFPTSGSTAASKIVAQTYRAITANALAVKQHHRLQPGDRFLGCLPIHHVNGLHFSVMATVFCGSHAILLRGFDPFQYPKMLADFSPRIASVVPSILQALVDTWRDAEVPEGFEYFVSAAAPLTRKTAESVWNRWGLPVLQGYGLTETINFSTTLPTGLSRAAYARQMLEPDIPSIGVQVAGNEVGILRPDGTPAASGENGEICVRGHNVMARYVGNREATAQAFQHGWFHTGDIGHTREDAEAGADFVVITGREKNIAKIRGESVSLEEMERILQTIAGVRDVACSALPDRLLGESIVIALDAEAHVEDAQVLTRLRGHFSEALLPRRILRVEKIPRTRTGKLLRPQLTEQLQTALMSM
ncbi:MULTISPECIES: class I adenylate-forming enzyme family protein [unclassified Pseudomonas]|uniref:class I adenylate-forming enzyme family protein n=1 Tax=unclassified Pseudomonas TaxID=196821 RepID=UPI001A9F4F09|nr:MULTISPECIES: class I adenylate-forming enzyme family protein [unclassified Pseudomonas]